MMAQPSNAPSNIPVSVIGSQFMAPHPIELVIAINSSGDHLSTDVNHRIMFKVKPCNSSYHERRILLDADDKPIVMIQEKIMSLHDEWNVFRGDSKEDSDLIFRTKTPKIIQSKTNVHVFLANKTSSCRTKDACDFMLMGSWSNRSCTIYRGASSMTIAQMHKIQPSEESKFVKSKFMVTIYPNVNYAFVVTLIAIVEAMNTGEDDAAEAIGAVASLVIGTAFS